MIILDTNVISELMRPEPSPKVSEWLTRQKPLLLAVTTITIAEITRGLADLPRGKRRTQLETAFTAFTRDAFSKRILPFDLAATESYAQVSAKRKKKGLHADSVDMMIAAIAASTDAAIATRNTGDFSNCGIKLINPWS